MGIEIDSFRVPEKPETGGRSLLGIFIGETLAV